MELSIFWVKYTNLETRWTVESNLCLSEEQKHADMSAFAIWQTQFVNMSLKVASNGPSVYVFMLLQKNGKCHFGTATGSISRRGCVSGLFDLCSQSLSDLVSCLVSPLPPVTGHGNWPFGGQPANKWTNEPQNSSISCHRSGRKREWTLDCLSPDFRAIARGPCHFLSFLSCWPIPKSGHFQQSLFQNQILKAPV